MNKRYEVNEGTNRSGNPYWYLLDTNTNIPGSKRYRSLKSAEAMAKELNK